MKKNSIIIIDTKGQASRSWKMALSEKYEIIASATFDSLQKGLPDLIILNMHSQKELDLNILRRIIKNFSSVPVIVLSSYRYWSKSELMKWGISNVVVKPFLISVLEEKIEEVLSNRVVCLMD